MNVYYVAGMVFPKELRHSGVKNQKWGVRRYQNLDGSLTPLGRIHYGVGERVKKSAQAISEMRAARAEKNREKYLRKHPEKMTDEELKTYTERVRAEKAYKDLINQTPSWRRKDRIKDAIEDAFKQSIKTIMSKSAEELGAKFAKKLFGDKELEAAKRTKELLELKSQIENLADEGGLRRKLSPKKLKTASNAQIEAYKNRLIDLKQVKYLENEVFDGLDKPDEKTDGYNKTQRYAKGNGGNSGGKNKNKKK